jgi:hypothetical protein
MRLNTDEPLQAQTKTTIYPGWLSITSKNKSTRKAQSLIEHNALK